MQKDLEAYESQLFKEIENETVARNKARDSILNLFFIRYKIIQLILYLQLIVNSV